MRGAGAGAGERSNSQRFAERGLLCCRDGGCADKVSGSECRTGVVGACGGARNGVRVMTQAERRRPTDRD